MLNIKTVENIEITKNVFVKPEYLINSVISGNKLRKLKYNIQEFLKSKSKGIITFGGAYSNHINAVATVGKHLKIPTIGFIRGEEIALKHFSNPTLSYAMKCGMKLIFLSRGEYKKKDSKEFLANLKLENPNYFIIPEGGTNLLGVKGCEEILSANDRDFDFICCSVGTGGTFCGLINSSLSHQKIIGFSATKVPFIKEDICKFVVKSNWDLNEQYHMGGYGKVNTDLIEFINDFNFKYKIQLDPIYTGKMMYGIFDLQKKHFFSKKKKILAIHSGGLQGIKGMNLYLKSKNLNQIK